MSLPVRSFASAVVLLGIVLIVGGAVANSTNFDFRAFYCAGSALRQHADPYRTEPLHSCEWKGTDKQLAGFARQIIVPAPQPGYDMAAFALLSYVPFTVAARLWALIVVLSCTVTIVAAQRLSGLPISVVTVAFWLSLVLPSIFLGELIPLCVASIAVAALCAQRQQWALAGIFGAAALVEPHVGLPVCLTILWCAPRARLATCLSLLALGTISLMATGFQWNLEYLADVLPAHALSEIGSDAQLSLSVALHWFGVPDRVALRFGTLLYAGLAAAAVYVSRNLSKKFADDSFLITVPAAFAVMGGMFIHVTEAALAVPFLLSIMKHLGPRRSVAAAGIVLLAVPWWSMATPMLFTPSTALAMVAFSITFLAWRLSGENVPAALATGAFATLVAAGLVLWHAMLSVPFTSINPPADLFSARYPEASWAWFNTKYMSTGSPPTWFLRALTWLGLLCAAYQAFAAARHSSKRLSDLPGSPRLLGVPE